MQEPPNKSAFMEFAGGAMIERVDHALGEIFNNIIDPNTAPDKVRKLTLTVSFKPNADRTQIGFEAVVKTALQPTHAIGGGMAVVPTPETGEIALVEMVPQVPGQLAMNDEAQPQPKVLQFPAQVG